MLFQQLNRDEADKVYIIAKNISGAAMSAGVPTYIDTADDADGHSVSGARTGQDFLFAGIAAEAIADDGIGRVQVYGKGSAYAVLNATGVSAVAGEQLVTVDSAAYLKQYTDTDVFTATSSAAWLGGAPGSFVTLMEGIASAASAQTTAALKSVFIRAL